MQTMRIDRDHQRGEGKLKTLIILLVFLGAAFCAWRIVPPYVDNYQLEDSMRNEARFAQVNRKSEDDVRQDMWKKVQELGIPARHDDIKVETNAGIWHITINYAVPVDLSVYQLTLHFHSTADSTVI